MFPGVQKVWENEPSHSQVNSHCGSWSLKWTPKFLKRNRKGQNQSIGRFFYIIGKILKCKNGLALPIWTSETQVTIKRKVKNQIVNLTPDHKKSTFDLISLCASNVRHTARKLLIRATTLLQTSSQLEVCMWSYGPQSCESPNGGNFAIPTWESRTKGHLDVTPMERCNVYSKREGGGFPQVRAMVSLVNPSLPMARFSTKSAPTMH